MRRLTLVTTLMLLAVGVVSAVAADRASAHIVRPVYSSTCKANWKTTYGNEKQIKCFANYFGVSAKTAAAVAKCESGFRWNAYNPAGPYRGTWQYSDPTWNAYRPHMLPKNPESGPFQGRHATMMTMRYVRHYGWNAWGCA